MNFKIGDKVRVVEEGTMFSGKVGIIFEVRGPERIYEYAAYFGNNRSNWQPFHPYHLKSVAPKKGEQLLLFEL